MAEVVDPSFNEVIALIRAARAQAFQTVNTALIDLYWQLGEYISRKVISSAWGEGVIDNLACFIADGHPDLKGFTRSNLFRMRQLFEAYRDDEKVAPLVRQLPWAHNLLVLSKCKLSEEREFYIRLAVRDRLPKRELERQIDGCLFERKVLAPVKVSPLVTLLYPAVQEEFKDSYLVGFLDLPEQHSEKDLQKGLLKDLKKVLMELGRDFCFVGEEYRLQVGGQDFFVDLLFFHRGLSCLVAFEIKVTDFKPDYMGQLDFYLEALDRDVRKPHEKPSIGVLLCKSKDAEVVEYALSRTLSPALVAEYKTRLPEKAFLQQKLREFYDLEADKKEGAQ
ncbi:MAG: DUF1016 family protein [Candidatus Omnitrophica bacterium]|nr:DUF1016 family protein [Candidatus Omnitrophota bacterium]